MTETEPLPRFRKPPVSEVAVGVQFQSPALTPIQMGNFYQRIKAGFPGVAVHPPLPPAFEDLSPAGQIPLVFPGNMLQPRMWFMSEDASSLIQLQNGRLLFNWRAGPSDRAYPHFGAVEAEFKEAFDLLEAMVVDEGLGSLIVNQCELVYINPLPSSATGVPLSQPSRIFRTWSSETGGEWDAEVEDIAFNLRYRLKDNGHQVGRLTAAVSSGRGPDGTPAFQLELTARGRPLTPDYAGIAAFHGLSHRAIVSCFAAITTPDMHLLWERYQ